MCGEASFKVAAAAFDSLGFVFLPLDFELDSPNPRPKKYDTFLWSLTKFVDIIEVLELFST